MLRGSMCDEVEQQLDVEYLHVLRRIKPFITCIINTHYIGLIKLWLERLSDVRFHNKPLRNTYLLRLGKQIEDGVLEEPFISPPPPPDKALDATMRLPSDEEADVEEEQEEEEEEEEEEEVEEYYAAIEPPSSPCGDGELQCDSPTPPPPPPPAPPGTLNESCEEQEAEDSWTDVTDLSVAAPLAAALAEVDEIARLQRTVDELRAQNATLTATSKQTALENENWGQKVQLLKVELQTTIDRNLAMQRDMFELTERVESFQAELIEEHQKELQEQAAGYDAAIKVLRDDQEHATAEFQAKYANLQEWYHASLEEQAGAVESKCTQRYDEALAAQQAEAAAACAQFEAAKRAELERLYEEKLEQVRMLDSNQAKLCDLLLAEARVEHRAQCAALQLAHERCCEEVRTETRRQVEECKAACEKDAEGVRMRCHAKLSEDTEDLRVGYVAQLGEERERLLGQLDQQKIDAQVQLQAERLRRVEQLEEQRVEHQAKLEQLLTQHAAQLEQEKSTALAEERARAATEATAVTAALEVRHRTAMDALRRKVRTLRTIVTKMEKLFLKAEKECAKQVARMKRMHELREAKNRIRMAAQRVDRITAAGAVRAKEVDELITNLEAKYKRALTEQQNATVAVRQIYTKKIAAMQADMGLAQLLKHC